MIRFLRQIKVSIKHYIGIRHCVRDLLCDVNNYV